MDRRHLIATSFIALCSSFRLATPGSAVSQGAESNEPPIRQAFRAFSAPGTAARDELAMLNARIWEFRSDRSAANAFADAAERLEPPEQPFGEIYVMDTRIVTSIPGLDLSARLLTWTIVAGAAAVETSFGMVVMQRDRFVWGMFAKTGQDSTSFSGLGDIITDLAVRLADRQVQREEVTVDDDGLFRGGLWDLLPDEADVPAGMTLEDQRTDDLDDPGTLIATRIDQRKAA